MKQVDTVYRNLQKHIDNMPVGFPQSASGLDIRLLKHLFTPEEAQIALELSALPEPLRRIQKRLEKKGIDVDNLEQMLDHLVKKGAILDFTHFVKNAKKRYFCKAMMVVGMFELQAENLTKEFAKDFTDYVEEGFYKTIQSKKTSQMRTIPINTNVSRDTYIDTYDNVREIVKNASGKIVVLHCVCRDGRDLLKDPCKSSDIRETCLVFEETASMLLDMGRGRLINKEEAMEKLHTAEKAGFILNPSNSRKPQFICCCCGCCCEALRSVKMLPKPVEYFHSNYYSRVDSNLCVGCEECVESCHMNTLSLIDDTAVVDYDRCIGCGVCVSKCQSNAIKLKKKKDKYIPPKNHEKMYQKILMEKIGLFGMMKMIPKKVLGKKI